MGVNETNNNVGNEAALPVDVPCRLETQIEHFKHGLDRLQTACVLTYLDILVRVEKDCQITVPREIVYKQVEKFNSRTLMTKVALYITEEELKSPKCPFPPEVKKLAGLRINGRILGLLLGMPLDQINRNFEQNANNLTAWARIYELLSEKRYSNLMSYLTDAKLNAYNDMTFILYRLAGRTDEIRFDTAESTSWNPSYAIELYHDITMLPHKA
jgi:hypothetical protein